MTSSRTTFPHIVRSVITLLSGLAVTFGVGTHPLRAQSAILQGERTIEFRTGRAFALPLTVGAVKFTNVEFTNLGRGYGRGGLAGRLRSTTSASEASTTLRAHFLAENPTADEWEVTIAIEFRDRSGKVIERVTKKDSWEGEAKPFDFDTEILEYMVR